MGAVVELPAGRQSRPELLAAMAAVHKGGGVSARAWREIPAAVRQALVAFCTDRENVELWCHKQWADFTADERARIASTARLWHRGLQGAMVLR